MFGFHMVRSVDLPHNYSANARQGMSRKARNREIPSIAQLGMFRALSKLLY
jgi:hypothetical protein